MDSQNQMVEIAPGFFVRSWDEIERADIDPFARPGSLRVYLKTSSQAHFVAPEHVPATLKAWRKHFGINSPFVGDYPENEPNEDKPLLTVGEKRKGAFSSTAVVLALFTAVHDHPNRGQYSFSVYPPAKIEKDILEGDKVVIYFHCNAYYMTTESHFIDHFPPLKTN